MTIVLIFFVIFILLLFLLKVIVRYGALVVLAKMMRKVRLSGGKVEVCELLKEYFKAKREQWLFRGYIFILTLLIEQQCFPNVVGLFVYNDEKKHFYLKIAQEYGISDTVSIAIIISITLVYLVVVFFRLKKVDASKISHAADIVVNEYEFKPNDGWFEKITSKAIKDLGKRYNEAQNYPYKDLDLILASLNRDKSTLRFIENAFEDVYKRCRRYSSHKDETKYSEVTNAVSGILKCLQGDYCTKEVVDTILENCKPIDNFIVDERKELHKQKGYQTSSYDLNELSTSVSDFEEVMNNLWMAGLRSNVMIVNGMGGIGKSHLLADIASKRIRKGEPTLLCLGMHITTDEDPLLQILSHMDLHCKKGVFLQGLNNYGKHVVIIVDGINEGKGAYLWQNHLDSFVNEFRQYENIQLIISYRTSGSHNFFNDYANQKDIPVYNHKGFEDNPIAIEYMFHSYGISLPTFPFFSEMFSNPMFLTLYCRSHEVSGKPTCDEDRWGIVNNYTCAINTNLARKFEYMEEQNLVELCLLDIADEILRNGYVDVAKAQQLVCDVVASFMNDGTQFLQSLIDEGLLMIQESYGGRKYVTFGYDTMKDIYLAYCLVKRHEVAEWFNNKGSIYDYSYLAYFAPKKEEKELFDYVEPRDRKRCIKNYFLPIYSWRKDETESGKKIVANLISSNNYEEIFELCILCAHRKELSINAAVLTSILKSMDFRKRDAVWTTRISGLLAPDAMRIAEWGWGISENALQCIGKEELKLVCELLIWCLASTNIKLRDCTTKALVNLLCNNADILSSLIDIFHDVDDLYIKERLWAVVMGCCLNCNSKDDVRMIAQKTYDKVFSEKKAEQHFLLRIYALYVVEYALNKGCLLNIDRRNLERPYNTTSKIPVMPTTDYVKSHYVESYDTAKDKDEWAAKTRILDSMKTEYSSRGLYGDYGRYVFQNLMDEWDYDPEMLSNWALKMIFDEMGYDSHAFAFFDTYVARGDRSENEIERIGKKYQWIATYKIMAIIDDAYQEKNVKKDWKQPIFMRARDIDPTIRLNPHRPHISCGVPIYKCPTYDFPKYENGRHWNYNYKEMPDISRFVECSDDEDNEWINLFSYNTIKSSLTENGGNGLEKELWVFLQSMIVDMKDLKPMLKAINKDGLRGRHSTENHECMYLFYREYYWSEMFCKEVQDSDWSHRPYRTSIKEYDNIEVEPTYLIYYIESSMDKSFSSSQEYLIPSNSLYKGLNMTFDKNEGCWNDPSTDNRVCLDNSIFHKGRPALLIRKFYLLDYLRKEKKAIVWPILMERSTSSSPSEKNYTQAGGYAWMDYRGKLHHKFRLYEPTRIDNIKSRLQGWTSKLHRFRMKRGWANEEELFLFKLEELCGEKDEKD